MLKKAIISLAAIAFIVCVVSAEKAKKQRDFKYARYDFLADEVYDAMTEATRRVIRSIKDIPDAEVKRVPPDVVKAWMSAGEKLVIIDVRKWRTYQDSHIKTAVSIPIASIETEFKKIPWEGKVVLYCGSSSCPLSFAATKRLLALGFTNVMDLEGGIKSWRDLGYPIETRVGASESE